MLDIQTTIQGKRIYGILTFYPQEKGKDSCFRFAQVSTGSPITVQWGDRFKYKPKREHGFTGEGTVLDPFSEKISRSRMKKKLLFLKRLRGDHQDMLMALALERGIQGLSGDEICRFSGLSAGAVSSLFIKLEQEGEIRILNFRPPLIISQPSLHFLCEKVLTCIEKNQRSKPDAFGISMKKIRQRIKAPTRALALAVGRLIRERKIKQMGDCFAPAGFQVTLSPEDEKLLEEMEQMAFQGELRSIFLEDMRQRLHISTAKSEKLLSLLIERKKVVQSKEGFFLHSKWLDDIVVRIRNSGTKELSVSDFKQMTGLSRKYVIPLLELLDQMGITQRKGATREILT